MDIILGILKESFDLLNKMSVYLLFGFIFAGILHVFLKADTIASHLGKNKLSSVVKASLFGIPLPLCSCGVIPATLTLKRDGASKGAILSFLISTPTTGIDSMFATYALMGPFFAIYRVIASFFSGIFAGVMANIFLPSNENSPKKEEPKKCDSCGVDHKEHEKTKFLTKFKGVFTYSFGVLLAESGGWILIGILIGGAISYFIPTSIISTYLGSPWLSMLVMLVVGIPMYICSSGSIPVAAALILKGMNPAAAFVFLLAGPATNSVALAVIGKEFGKKTVFVFLSSIIFCSVFFGILLDYLLNVFNIDIAKQLMHHVTIMPVWIEIGASSILLGGMAYSVWKHRKK